MQEWKALTPAVFGSLDQRSVACHLSEVTMRRSDTGSDTSSKEKPSRRIRLGGWIIASTIVLILNLLFYLPFVATGPPPPVATLSYSDFLDRVQQGVVRDVTIEGLTLTGDFNQPVTLTSNGQQQSYTRFVTQVPSVGDRLLDLLEAKHVEIVVHNPEPPIWLQVLGLLLNA